jgi:hypothetical protein
MAAGHTFPSAPRRVLVAGLLVLFGGAVLAFVGSRATGPTFDELGRIAICARANVFARAFSDVGLSATVSSSARSIYDDLSPFGVIPALISGSMGESLARLGVVDRLTGVRLGWLLVTMTAPLSLFLVVEASRGLRVAALAVCILAAIPRWSHATAVASEPAVVTSLWLLVLASYVRSLPLPIALRKAGVRRRHRASAALFGLVFGLAVAINSATLWVVPLIVLHYFTRDGLRSLRALRRGVAPVPAAFLGALCVSPLVVLLLTPKLWRGGAVSAAEWLFLPLSPSVEPVTYAGALVTADTVPRSYAAGYLAATVPVVIALCALGGLVVMLRDHVRARRDDRSSDPAGLGPLVLLGLVAVMLGPALEPRVFLRFPPRVEAGLPWIAAACAVAVDRMSSRAFGERRTPWMAALAVAAAMVIGFVRLPTAGASFSLFVGGTRGALAGKTWPVGDGSEVAVIGRAIDKLQLGGVSIRAPDVPKNYFAVLSSTGRLSTRVELSASAGDLTLVRGPRRGAIATADQGGATLWSLSRRR